MLLLSPAFAAISIMLALGFYRKYEQRLRSGDLDATRYSRIGDYYGRPILLAFEYRPATSETPSNVEVDVDEIYHYGRDYYLKGHSPDRKRRQVFKWSRVSHPRVRHDGRTVESLEALFLAAENDARRAVA